MSFQVTTPNLMPTNRSRMPTIANTRAWELNISAGQFLVQFLTLIALVVLVMKAFKTGLATASSFNSEIQELEPNEDT